MSLSLSLSLGSSPESCRPQNRHPPPLLPSATPPLTHTMTSLPHPAHTRQQLPIFSPKMHFADMPYKDACLYQVSTTKPSHCLFFFLSSLPFSLSVFAPHFPSTPSPLSINLPVCVCVSLAARQTHGQSGYSRTEQIVTESVSGCLCCSWLIAALSPLWFF